jgi:hypothetical protein
VPFDAFVQLLIKLDKSHGGKKIWSSQEVAAVTPPNYSEGF